MPLLNYTTKVNAQKTVTEVMGLLVAKGIVIDQSAYLKFRRHRNYRETFINNDQRRRATMVTVLDRETQRSHLPGAVTAKDARGVPTTRRRCANSLTRSIRTCIRSAAAADTASSAASTATTLQTWRRGLNPDQMSDHRPTRPVRLGY